MHPSKNRWDRAAVLVVLLSLVAGLGASWLWAGRVRGAQEQERRDLNLHLESASAGWAEVTDRFFAVPESAARLVGALGEDITTDAEHIRLLAEAIRLSPALDAAFVGYPNGEFIFVARSDAEAEGGFRTRTISLDGPREVLLTWTDASLNELKREIDAEDTYDPRARPWYLQPGGAAASWTSPYVFASSQQPGITYSTRVEGTDAVIGIDMRLTELGGFLDQLAPGENGEAAVIDAQAEVIAASSLATTNGLDAPLFGLDTSDLLDSIARIEAGEAASVRLQSSDGLSTLILRPARTSQDWYIAAQALDSDFLGDFSNGSAKNIFGILAIGLASMIIIGSLAYWLTRDRAALKHEAERDELTGLLSRRALRRRLDSALAGSQPVVVAIIDLDRFKAINDLHGHLTGDRVLAGVAARIDTFARGEGASVGRLGGDEFAVIANKDLDWSRLAAALTEPLVVDGRAFDVGASIGVAHAALNDDQAEDVLQEADRALFDVKRSGGAGFALAGDVTIDARTTPVP